MRPGTRPRPSRSSKRLRRKGIQPAAFICEPFYGNAGGIALPDGYLAAVYDAVRAAGGLAIADEVQVGYGRLGNWFWGFQGQGVVPDIVTVAKAMGNGQPLGAVITTRAIADAYRSQGYFFSSAGGSPVSSRRRADGARRHRTAKGCSTTRSWSANTCGHGWPNWPNGIH